MIIETPRVESKHIERVAVLSRDYSRLARTVFSQEKVSKLTVLVIGAGALGNEVIKNLALMGVGRLWIIDRDHVELSNLTRSILFCTPEIEKHIESKAPKAELAAARVREINPDVEVKAFVGEFADLGLGVVRRCDVVFSCLDNEMARLEAGWACNRLDKPLVDGGLGLINYSNGLVSIFPGKQGPCYACRKGNNRRRQLLQELYGREDPCWIKEKLQEESDIVSTTPLMSSVVAAFQVEVGLRKLLNGDDAEPELGRAFRVALAPEPSLETFTFARSPNCPLHEQDSYLGEVREFSDASSSERTPEQLLEETSSDYISLDWPYTAEARCQSCSHEWKPLVRRSRFRKAVCPECGSAEVGETEVMTEIEKGSDWAKKTFQELGFPAGNIYEVVADPKGEARRVHFELTGDMTTVV